MGLCTLDSGIHRLENKAGLGSLMYVRQHEREDQ